MKRALSAVHDSQFNTFILIPGYRRTGGRSYAALRSTGTGKLCRIRPGGLLFLGTLVYACLLGPDSGDRNLKRWCRVPLPTTLHQSTTSRTRLVQ